MRRMLLVVRHGKSGGTREAGFVLVAAMVVLLALSIFGIWAIRTSTFELNIAGSTQRAEKQFNVGEGAAILEAQNVGFTVKGFYANQDPYEFYTICRPLTDPEFDPGNDTTATLVNISPADSATWPMDNLVQNLVDDEFDYRYLTTFIGSGPLIGYGENFLGYDYRIQGQGLENGVGSTVVEVGGAKAGPK